MKSILTLTLTLLFYFSSHAQTYIENPIPIKDCRTKEDLSKDSIFPKLISTLHLDFSNYELMYISDFIKYRDSLLSNKIYFKTLSIKVNYKHIEESNIKKFVSSYNPPNNPIDTKKRFMCYRTIIPDKNQNYQVYFSIIE